MTRVDAPLILDGQSLRVEELARAARDPRVAVACDPAAMQAVARCRAHVEKIVRDYEAAVAAGGTAPRVYGVTTGFGEFKNRAIAPAQLEQIQQNLLRSHAVGTGDNADADDPANYFPAEVVRAALIIRLNTFLKGHSGVRPELCDGILRMINRGIVPLAPTRGSVGSSGDLCPLAHLFVVLLGEGRYYVVRQPGERTWRSGGVREAASTLCADLDLAALPAPTIKEGLALSNGATFSAAMLALAVADADALARVADVSAALCLEAVGGRSRALDPRVHEARAMPGQIASAAAMRAALEGSRLADASAEVQDSYSVRCAPQVHGASRDALGFARGVVDRELNAATDNPLFFPGGAAPWDRANFSANQPPEYTDEHAYSAGNFHGQPLALAADFLAIALAELADISERRTTMLLDEHHSRGLPANLVPRRGLNSGLMIAQYCAAGLVSENKVLAHPASVDSIPTSANVEDHVAMATHAARKLRTVLANAQAVLAIELLVGTAAVEWRAGMGIAPRAGGAALDAEAEATRFEAAVSPQGQAKIAAQLGRGTRIAYQAVRRCVRPLLADRVLAPDVQAVRQLVESGALAQSL